MPADQFKSNEQDISGVNTRVATDKIVASEKSELELEVVEGATAKAEVEETKEAVKNNNNKLRNTRNPGNLGKQNYDRRVAERAAKGTSTHVIDETSLAGVKAAKKRTKVKKTNQSTDEVVSPENIKYESTPQGNFNSSIEEERRIREQREAADKAALKADKAEIGNTAMVSANEKAAADREMAGARRAKSKMLDELSKKNETKQAVEVEADIPSISASGGDGVVVENEILRNGTEREAKVEKDELAKAMRIVDKKAAADLLDSMYKLENKQTSVNNNFKFTIAEIASRNPDLFSTTKDQDGNTLLMAAIKHDYYEVAVQLVMSGADINLVNKDGETALDLTHKKEKEASDVLTTKPAEVAKTTPSWFSFITRKAPVEQVLQKENKQVQDNANRIEVLNAVLIDHAAKTGGQIREAGAKKIMAH